MTRMSSVQDDLGNLSAEKAELLQLLLQRQEGAVSIAPYPRQHSGDTVTAPTSWAQRRLWFIDQLEGGGLAYNVPLGWRLTGALNEVALRAALDEIVRRHESLRTVFVTEEGVPTQQIFARASFLLETVDLSGFPETGRAVLVQRQKDAEAGGAFDLRRGPLIRGRLLRLGPEEHVLLITMHHIITDAWSFGVFNRELKHFYEAALGTPSSLCPLPIQYADYAEWQRESMRRGALDEQLDYWSKQLHDAVPVFELPTDRPRPTTPSYEGESIPFVLGADLSASIRKAARARGMTPFMLLYAAWSLLLAHLSGQDDIVVGTPVANRQDPQLEGVIGFLVNTLALRVRVVPEQSLEEFLEHVRDVVLGAYDNQDVPFDKVVEAVQPQRSLSRNPVFQTMLAFQNAPESALELRGLKVTAEPPAIEPAILDLVFSIAENAEGFSGFVTYATALFESETVDRWIDCLTVLLRALATEPSTARVSDLPMLSNAARREVLELFNDTETDFPREYLLHEIVEQWALRTPDATAVVDGETRLTYAELNGRANRLAQYLIARGIRSSESVPVIGSRSADLIVAQLGVLKAGGVYVPIDPTLSRDRRTFIVADCDAKTVINFVAAESPGPGLSASEWIDWAEARPEIERCDGVSPRVTLSRPFPAYVMYTSGSTGTPKGVIVPHHAIARLAVNNGYAQFRSDDRFAHCSNTAFDASTFEIWVPLLNGASIAIVPQPVVLEACALDGYLTEKGVTVLFLTTALFNQHAISRAGMFSRLRCVLFGGEAADTNAVRAVLAGGRPQRLLNLYGPTETTTFATCLSVSFVDAAATALPIGRPISNTTIYILDEALRPVPVGVAGEIYIGGKGVALGYLNRPDLTAARFVKDPFCGDPAARMYRTGDLGRWRSDGNIDFLGRNDQQVKLRGFRIELGEIEAQLVRHPRVSEAAVILREVQGGTGHLVAYVRTNGEVRVDELRAHVRSMLPVHMVPSAFVSIDRFPLTPNGKLDRRALPAPDLSSFVTNQYEPPVGDREQLLAGIWQELLGISRVGRHDNFFELGGHSLLIVRMLDRLRRAGLPAEVQQVFESPTLAGLSQALGQATADRAEVPPNKIPAGCTSIAPEMLPLVDLRSVHIENIAQAVPGGARNVQDIYPLTPLQEGILFHHLLDRQRGDTYVLPVLLSVASREVLGELIRGLQNVIERHDALRTAILWERLPAPVQVVLRAAILPVEEFQLDSDFDVSEQLSERTNPERQKLDLTVAPLMRVQVADDPHGKGLHVILQIHHLICDHESLEAMLTDVSGFMQGRQGTLHEAVPYRNHVWQALERARTNDARVFFRQKLEDVFEPTLPFGLSEVRGDTRAIREVNERLDPELAQQIRRHARRLGVSPATLFHAAWALVVAHTSDRDDIVFGTVLLGRLQGAGASRTLGMFINTLPVRFRLAGIGAAALVERAHQELTGLLRHEQASLAEVQRCSGVLGSVSLFTSILNYRHSARDFDSAFVGTPGVGFISIRTVTNYPISLGVDDLGDGFGLDVRADPRIDSRRLLGYMRTAIQSLISALEEEPETQALRLSILPETERRQVVEGFNATEAAYPEHKTIHALFEEQVVRTPDAMALRCRDVWLTYSQLNRRANQLAHHLQARGIRPDDRVALFLERSPHLVVAILAVLKTGAAYMPLDMKHPAGRLSRLIDDAEPVVVLTEERLKSGLPPIQIEVISLDVLSDDERSANAADPICPGLTSDHMAYLIYTSGSTGEPKGVMVCHRNLVNYSVHVAQQFGVAEGGGSLVGTSMNFDLALTGFFPPLICGRSVTLCTDEEDLSAVVQEGRRLCPVKLTPSHLATLNLAEVKGCVNTLVLGGEPLRASALRWWRTHSPETRIFNHYGPTETTVGCIVHEVRGESDGFIPIGRPISNTRAYILDRTLSPAPIGVVGELYIGGAGVARGYWKRQRLTAERFLRDPFSSDPDARLYRTGDLARWKADGTLEYIGRNDFQVKLRGFRVELGEIEAQLLRHPHVKETAVLAREDVPGDIRLVAYVVGRGTEAPSPEELRAFLKASLPDYMVPAAFVALDRLPLTTNGKLDRRVLPVPEASSCVSREYETPREGMEEALAPIWQELLRVDRVGRNDNFFDLGGHSLLATRMMSRIRELLGLDIPLRTLFEAPSLVELAGRVQEQQDRQLDQDELTAMQLRRQIDHLDDEGVAARIAQLEKELGGALTRAQERSG